MGDYIEREAALREFDTNGSHFVYGLEMCRAIQSRLKMIPAADVPPALWTDEPISGTEFMTHNQGQSGFEIHFRTDDKAKYEAVQDECRRQIGHAKPAADVRPVVRGRWKLGSYSGKYGSAKEKWYDQFFDGAFWYCDQCRERARKSNFCPNCGADMRGAE